jgi:hypothetical protein
VGKPAVYYVLLGATPPTPAEVVALKAMPHEAAFAVWKAKHSQVRTRALTEVCLLCWCA